MSIGMNYHEFWDEDPTIAKFYYKAYLLKEKRKAEMDEWHMWKQGVYMYEALCDVSPILHAFCKKGTKPLPFPKEPYGIERFNDNNVIEKTEEEKKQEAENERLKATIFFDNWAKSTQEQFAKKKNNKVV